MSKSKTPDAEQLKKEWAELARKIEEITGEKPAQEPPKPVCANCKWKVAFITAPESYYWKCRHKDYGVYAETYNPMTGETAKQYRDCKDVNNGECPGFEPKTKRTWVEWLRSWVDA